MPPPLDLTGQRFGRLTVAARAENGPHKKTRWRCRCDCGAEVVVGTLLLRSGRTRSCGCLDRERSAAQMAARRKERPQEGPTAAAAVVQTLACRLCGEVFVGSYRRAYCSEECRRRMSSVQRRTYRNRSGGRSLAARLRAATESLEGRADG